MLSKCQLLFSFLVKGGDSHEKSDIWFLFYIYLKTEKGFPGNSVGKESATMQDTKEMQVLSLGQEYPLEEENGSPFKNSSLKNLMDRGA